MVLWAFNANLQVWGRGIKTSILRSSCSSQADSFSKKKKVNIFKDCHLDRLQRPFIPFPHVMQKPEGTKHSDLI
ncbi:hypothetical protein I79_022958 [Cricetulus griseus]|uniref:Uncharacterized protein n=1 Tax=Cricetulus griseus TaxID=10029 RepID=G3IGN8_CRIGR|nr:hypothetical protein I79_022958 [Cricetulus griseus]